MSFKFNPTTGQLDWVASPGGSTTELQYNKAGVFDGVSGVTTDGTDLFFTGPISFTANTTFDSTEYQIGRINTGSADGMGFSIPSGGFGWSLGGSFIGTLSNYALNLRTRVAFDSAPSGTENSAYSVFRSSGGNLALNVPTGGEFAFSVNGVQLAGIDGSGIAGFQGIDTFGNINTSSGNISGVNLTASGYLSAKTSLILEDPGAGTETVTIQSPTLGASYTLTLPTTDGGANEVLQTDGSGTLSWTALPSAVTPGGSDTQIQFNDGGSFGGDADFTWDKTINALSVTGTIAASGAITSDTSLVLTDPGAGTNKITIQAPTLSGDYTLTLPVNDGDSGQALTTNGSGVLSWTTISATPGGSDTQLQYNNAGAFGGISGVTTNGTSLSFTSLLTWTGGTAITAGNYQIGRNADGTNLMQYNVPTGASHEMSVNDVAMVTVSSTQTTVNNAFAIPGSSTQYHAIGQAAGSSGTTFTIRPSASNVVGVNIKGVFSQTSDLFKITNNSNTELFVVDRDGLTEITPTSNTSGIRKTLIITPPNNTGLTLSTEIEQILVNTSTQTWATGALTEQSFYKFTAPTIAFAGASTVTTASTFTITDAVQAGTNATITEALALWVKAGKSKFGGKIDATAESVQVKRVTANVSNPPTDAELDSAFGDPTTVGAGFVGVVDDNDGGTDVWWVYTTGTAGEWFYVQGTKAV